MASKQHRLRADGTISYRIAYRIGQAQHIETFDSAGAADAFYDSIESEGLAGAIALLNARTRSRPDTMSVADYVARHIELVPNVTAGTRSTYRAYLARDIRGQLVGKVPLDQLDRQTVEAWVIYLARERHLSSKSIRNVQALLSAAMTRAVRDGSRASNPAVGVRAATSASSVEKVFLSGAEFATLLDQIPHYYRPLVGFLYGTAMRWGEATALKVGDVDLAASPASVRVARAWKHHRGGAHTLGPPKSAKGNRTIGMPPSLVQQIEPLLTGRRRDEFLFTNRLGGPVRENAFHASPWTPAVTAAEPIIHKRPRIHDLRHSQASNLIRLGVPLNVVQEILGHEKITTTVDTYGHLGPDHLMVAASAIAISLTDAYPELEG